MLTEVDRLVHHSDLLAMTAQVVSAQVAKRQTEPHELPDLISSVYKALSTADSPAVETALDAEVKQQPAVDPAQSIFHDYIVCLEDGRKLQMMKRHLFAAYGMTPEEYRLKWGLPSDYPMTAPGYSDKRSGLAKTFRLGHRPA